jgi:hypothetical protein
MNVTKRGRPRRLTDEQYRQILAWKRLSVLCQEIGVSKKAAERIRTKFRQVFQ